MHAPDVDDVHVNSLLTNFSIAYGQSEDVFIADKIFPIIGVDKRSDIYPVFPRAAWFRDHGDKMTRAPGTVAGRTGYKVDLGNPYLCVNEAIGTLIPKELRGNADTVWDLDKNATELVTRLQLIRRERLFASRFMSTGKWTTDRAGTTNFVKWSDMANSDPFGDMTTWQDLMRGLIGRKPNKLAIGHQVWSGIKNHVDFLDRIKGGATTANPALFTKQMFASWLEIDELLVFEGMYNNAVEDVADTTNLADIVADAGLLFYAPNSPSLMTPSAGYTFVWRPMVNGNAPQYIRKYYEEDAMTDVVESQAYFDQKITAPDAGIYLSDIL